LDGIVAQLEQQRSAIDKALAALREIGGSETPAIEAAAAEPATSTPATRKGAMSPEGKKRLSKALKKRWAAKKAAANAPAVSTPAISAQKPAARKTNFTPEGRKRLAEAMKRRWAVKRAGSAVKKGRKKAAWQASFNASYRNHRGPTNLAHPGSLHCRGASDTVLGVRGCWPDEEWEVALWSPILHFYA
jgi:hypothetical protein